MLRSYFGRSSPPIFAEPGEASLQKLVLGSRPSLDSINVRDLEDVRLMRFCNRWPEGATFISRCHSLTTLVTTNHFLFGPEQPPFTLPNLIYLDTVGFTMLEVAHTPKIQTLILNLDHDGSADTVVRLPSLPTLTTLNVIFGDLISDEITRLLALNTSIRRLILSECVGISDLVRLLKADDTGSAANTLGTMLLPSLSLLQVSDSPAADAGGLYPLFARRPTLHIEHSERCGPSHIGTDELKEIIEELGRNDEPGVFKSRDFKGRAVVREDSNAGLQKATAEA